MPEMRKLANTWQRGCSGIEFNDQPLEIAEKFFIFVTQYELGQGEGCAFLIVEAISLSGSCYML